ncbi:MAG: hypothetical protein JWM11_4173 [Planctomycetaceae bacterium]|nr:hypothetical protein [Planctomycetaceae bacterium]
MRWLDTALHSLEMATLEVQNRVVQLEDAVGRFLNDQHRHSNSMECCAKPQHSRDLTSSRTSIKSRVDHGADRVQPDILHDILFADTNQSFSIRVTRDSE